MKEYDTYISKLHLTNLPQSAHNFSTNFVGNVELGQGHVRRAEEGVLRDAHCCVFARAAAVLEVTNLSGGLGAPESVFC